MNRGRSSTRANVSCTRSSASARAPHRAYAARKSRSVWSGSRAMESRRVPSPVASAARSSTSSEGTQLGRWLLTHCLAEVLDEVVGGLHAARQTDEIRRDGGGRVLRRLVRHRLRHLDQRLHTTERLGEREDLRSGGD